MICRAFLMGRKQVYTLLSMINLNTRTPFITVSLLMSHPKFCTNYIMKNISRIVIYKGAGHQNTSLFYLFPCSKFTRLFSLSPRRLPRYYKLGLFFFLLHELEKKL